MNGSAESGARLCRNCGASAPGAFCGTCGQDTRPGVPTFAQFAREATGRYVALDGRLWRTLVPLLLRPGFLTSEYLDGRRRRYIGPARLFLVSSLLLFAILRFATDDIVVVKPTPAEPAASERAPVEPTGTGVRVDENLGIDFGPIAGAGGGVLRKRIERFNRLSHEQKAEQIVAGTFRYGPWAAFALLPAFALLLKVLYLGPARRHPSRPRLYGEHLAFGAHTHAFVFLAVSALVALPFAAMRWLVAAWIAVYLFVALRVVYGGSWLGTFLRSGAMLVAYAIVFAVATAGLLAVAILLR